MKAREISNLDPARARLIWPTYKDWLEQLIREEGPEIKEYCIKCNKILHVYLIKSAVDLDKLIESKVGPLPSPVCSECRRYHE